MGGWGLEEGGREGGADDTGSKLWEEKREINVRLDGAIGGGIRGIKKKKSQVEYFGGEAKRWRDGDGGGGAGRGVNKRHEQK